MFKVSTCFGCIMCYIGCGVCCLCQPIICSIINKPLFLLIGRLMLMRILLDGTKVLIYLHVTTRCLWKHNLIIKLIRCCQRNV